MVLLIAQAVTPAYVGIGEWEWENAINLIQESSPNRVSKTCPLPQYAPSQQAKKNKNRKRDELKYQRFRLTITHFSKSDGDVLLVPGSACTSTGGFGVWRKKTGQRSDAFQGAEGGKAGTRQTTGVGELFKKSLRLSSALCIPFPLYCSSAVISIILSEKAMAPHSSTLAWKIPWTEEPDKLQSMGSQRVRHDWATSLSLSMAYFSGINTNQT